VFTVESYALLSISVKAVRPQVAKQWRPRVVDAAADANVDDRQRRVELRRQRIDLACGHGLAGYSGTSARFRQP
jgi:hypothetical protein